ncbi:hypothetical protein FO519_010555, partial [Halicephalobus sp. NKZ332]
MTTETIYDSAVMSVLLIYGDIIGTLTSKTLGRYKWFVLNQSFWSFLFTMTAVIGKPIVLLPAAALFLGGALRNTSFETCIIFVSILLALTVMSIGGSCMTCAQR